jgi:hypothetical protein
VRAERVLARHLIFDPTRLRHSPGGIEDLQRDQVAGRVVIEDDAGLALIASATATSSFRTTLSVSV